MDELCLIVSQSGRRGTPLACALPKGHAGEHSWGSLPTFGPDGMTATEKAARSLLDNFYEFGTITDGEYINALHNALALDLPLENKPAWLTN